MARASGTPQGMKRGSLSLVVGLIGALGVLVHQSRDSTVSASAPEPSAVAEGCAHDEQALRCVRYLEAYDGDTFMVDVPGVPPLFGKRVSVRLRGIDTPEMRGQQPCEKEQARIAQRLVHAELRAAKRIDLVELGRDKYFRVLATALVDGRKLQDLLIKNGLALPYDGGRKPASVSWCHGRPRIGSREALTP